MMPRCDGLLEEIERVYRRDGDRFMRVALAITRDPDRAADAVQEAFAAAIRRRRSYRAEGPVEAWVWRMVVNAALRQHREPPLHELPDDLSIPTTNDVSEAGLEAVIGGLPPRQRVVLFLRYYADLDYRAIGAALGIEVGTVSATLHAAHRAVRRRLEEAQS